MADQTTTKPETDAPAPAASAPAPAPAFDPATRATELAILDALRTVVDPEIGMNVVELALIKQVILGKDQTEIKMILTTPFCPYAGALIQQIKEVDRGGRRARRQGHPPRRALGSPRRRLDVVGPRPR